MKKLIIAAAIVCAAVMSQAASVKWRTSGVTGVDEKSYSGSATLHALLTGTTTEVATYNGTMSAGAMNVVVGDANLVAGTFYDFYYTMTDSKGNVFTSGAKTNIQAQSNSTPSLLFGSTGSWSTVPEPTSGLLLLLGVAGLALKRKRA